MESQKYLGKGGKKSQDSMFLKKARVDSVYWKTEWLVMF